MSAVPSIDRAAIPRIPAPERPTLRALATPRRTKRPRVFYALIAVGSTGAILLAQLLLSIMLAHGSYQVSALQQQSKELGRTSQALQEQLAQFDSPQYLAEQAAALGMQSSTNTQYLSLSSGTVLPTSRHIQDQYLSRVEQTQIVLGANLVANANLDPASPAPVDATALATAASGLEQALRGLAAFATPPVVQDPPMTIVRATAD